MVTHDQALKNYAHRAVRMIDGRIGIKLNFNEFKLLMKILIFKLGKIEEIDHETRDKAL